MNKVLRALSCFIITALLFSQMAFAMEASFTDEMFKNIKDKKAEDILEKVTMKYVFGAMGALMGGSTKIDFSCKLNIAPSDYSKKLAGVSTPVGSFSAYLEGNYITVSPNIMFVDINSNFIKIKVLKRGKGKIRVGLPSNRTYTEVKSLDDIFQGKEKIEDILSFSKKKETKEECKEPKEKEKSKTKTETSYIGLNTVNNEKVHQVKFKTFSKESKNEIFSVILDITYPNYELRRLSLAHKLVEGDLVIKNLVFGKPKDIKGLDTVFQGYKKVKEDKFKETFYSVLLVNFFKLLK